MGPEELAASQGVWLKKIYLMNPRSKMTVVNRRKSLHLEITSRLKTSELQKMSLLPRSPHVYSRIRHCTPAKECLLHAVEAHRAYWNGHFKLHFTHPTSCSSNEILKVDVLLSTVTWLVYSFFLPVSGLYAYWVKPLSANKMCRDFASEAMVICESHSFSFFQIQVWKLVFWVAAVAILQPSKKLPSNKANTRRRVKPRESQSNRIRAIIMGPN